MIIGERIIADVFTLNFMQEKKVAIYCDKLKDAGIDIKVNKNDVRGGRGNKRIATLHSGKDITITATNPTFDYGVLAVNLGTNIVIGASKGYTTRQKIKATNSSGIKATLSEIPIGDIVVYDKTGKLLAKSTNYTVEGKEITFTTGVVADELVVVEPYLYATSEKTERISINENTYAKGGVLVLETIEIDNAEKVTAKIQFVFPNVIPTGEVNFATSSERKEKEEKMEFTVLSGDTDEIGYVNRIPIE